MGQYNSRHTLVEHNVHLFTQSNLSKDRTQDYQQRISITVIARSMMDPMQST